MTDLLDPDMTPSSRAPVFTLGSALRWLGHECPDQNCCRAPIVSMEASVWFVRLGLQFPTFPFRTRVLVDSTETGAALACVREMLDQASRCTRRDAIEIHYQPRSIADRPERLVRPEVPSPFVEQHQPTGLFGVPGASGDDLRTGNEAIRW